MATIRKIKSRDPTGEQKTNAMADNLGLAPAPEPGRPTRISRQWIPVRPAVWRKTFTTNPRLSEPKKEQLMTSFDQHSNLRIELDQKGCELAAWQIADMEEDLRTLKRLVEDFPVAVLHITVIYHRKPNDFHVKTSLSLCGNSFFAADRHHKMHPAYESCLRSLARKVRTHKSHMRVPDRETIRHM